MKRTLIPGDRVKVCPSVLHSEGKFDSNWWAVAGTVKTLYTNGTVFVKWDDGSSCTVEVATLKPAKPVWN